MSLRIKIAKWIAPNIDRQVLRLMGELAAHGQRAFTLNERLNRAEAEAKQWQANYETLVERFEQSSDALEDVYTGFQKRGRALRSIAKLRTPRAAHGVKKACDIADQALKTGERT